MLLLVAAALLEVVALCLWPALCQAPLSRPRRILGRLVLLSLPSLRSTAVGMGRMLERPPFEGPLGALVDLTRFILGEPEAPKWLCAVF